MTDFNPIIIIPSYNTGEALLKSTVLNALEKGVPLWVVIDGSTDGSDQSLDALLPQFPNLKILRKSKNTGKGDTVRFATKKAQLENYTHALTMDADGQHPAESIAEMLALAKQSPKSIIMGQPLFGEEAPWARVYGRKLTTFWTNIETLWCGLGDTLFGMRVYPLELMNQAFAQTRFARGFDFDPEIAVRMVWLGARPIKINIPVSYLDIANGGVSHFHYIRDNILLTTLHFRLIPEFLVAQIVPFIKRKKLWKN